MSQLSVVVPVYKEEKGVPAFLARIVPVLESVESDYEVIFALDPSPDRTLEVILQARQSNPKIKVVQFSRRFGQPSAVIAGLSLSDGAAVIVIDVDLQDPPELIGQMHRLWKDEAYDVVYAQRRSRAGESWVKRCVAYSGYWLIDRVCDVEIPRNTGDFRLISRRVVDQIIRLRERHGFLRGLVALVGFKQTAVQFDRAPRFAGQGNYNRFFGSIRIGVNGIICFSTKLLSLSSLFGFACAAAAFVGAVGYVVAKVAGFPFPIGNPTIVILVLFLSGVQLLSVGILGEYIGRIYEDLRERPRFIVDLAYGFEPDHVSK